MLVPSRWVAMVGLDWKRPRGALFWEHSDMAFSFAWSGVDHVDKPGVSQALAVEPLFHRHLS